MINFKYVPLSFMSKQHEIERQSLNTVIFQKVLEEFGELKSLGELLDSTQYGYTASAQEQGNFRFLRITDINNGNVNWSNVPYCNCERSEKYELSPKDILIARTGNNISYLVEDNVPRNTVFASYLIRLTCNQKLLLPEYLYFFLNSYAFWPQILKKQRGALLQNVNAKRMEELLIPYCSLDIQKKLMTHGNRSISRTQEKVMKLLRLQNSFSIELTHQQTLLKKLRQQILQEAIEGKLTQEWRKQNPDIQPASELFKRIQAEKAQLIKDKKIKKQKPLPPISEEEKPFELPDGWVWCRLGGIMQLNPRNKIADNLSVSFIPMRMIEDGYKNKHRSEIKKWADIKTGFTHFAENDVVVSKITPCFQNRKSAVLKNLENKYGAGTTELFVLRSYNKAFLSELVLFTVKTSKFIEQGVSTYKGTVGQQRVQKYFIETYIVALPPLPEQKAIVAKVEKLLALCDQLESQITRNQNHAEQLMQAVLKEAFSQDTTQTEVVAVNTQKTKPKGSVSLDFV